MSIIFEQVNYIYQVNTPYAYSSLKNINVHISQNQYTAIIGQTGSGKSTLIQHLNALLKPTFGHVQIDTFKIDDSTQEKQLKPLRELVGVVFQFPEAQLFEETILKDVMFGPMNFGKTEEEAKAIAIDCLHKVGIAEELFEQSPFDLSGGQMRRVAIAGILALNPKVLVLDEPSAGLDPKGQKEMMHLFYQLHKVYGITIILVTHHMEDVMLYANQVIVLSHGEVVFNGEAKMLFQNKALLQQYHINLPMVLSVANQLRDKGLPLSETIFSYDELVKEIKTVLRR